MGAIQDKLERRQRVFTRKIEWFRGTIFLQQEAIDYEKKLKIIEGLLETISKLQAKGYTDIEKYMACKIMRICSESEENLTWLENLITY